MVCREHYPDWVAVPCASFEDVFATVQAGDAELAMIPIDNSIAGRVSDIHHFLPTSGLHIIGEHFLRIQFALMGTPDATIEGLRTVHSTTVGDQVTWIVAGAASLAGVLALAVR